MTVKMIDFDRGGEGYAGSASYVVKDGGKSFIVDRSWNSKTGKVAIEVIEGNGCRLIHYMGNEDGSGSSISLVSGLSTSAARNVEWYDDMVVRGSVCDAARKDVIIPPVLAQFEYGTKGLWYYGNSETGDKYSSSPSSESNMTEEQANKEIAKIVKAVQADKKMLLAIAEKVPPVERGLKGALLNPVRAAVNAAKLKKQHGG